MNTFLKHIIFWTGILFFPLAAGAQNKGVDDIIVIPGTAVGETTIKSAEKLNDKPIIADTVKPIKNITYSITSKPVNTVYNPATIIAAKMVNEPLSKLYHCLIKAGYGNYNMPYGEIFINNTRSREAAYGFRYKHLSSNWRLDHQGYSGYSDNELYFNGKKFFKKHTLSGDFNYLRNAVHFYGYPQEETEKDKNFTKQVFNTIEAKVNLISHFIDSSKLNHDINFNFYNLTDRYKLNESYIGANGLVKTNIKGERLNIFGAVDYYNDKMINDTVNNTIVRLNPYFEAGGKKWKADIGLMAAIDKFSDSTAKFNFYPRLNVQYDIYRNLIVPYAGIGGDLKKNSFRSLAAVNPFIESTLHFKNTSTRLDVFGGIRGALSSNTNYDANVSYQAVSDLAMYLIDYSSALQNRFKMVYADGNILKVGGQLKYSYKEKINLIGQGNYYSYKMKDLKYAWHRPSFDIKITGNYNIKSKIITKMDLYFIGNQWALQETNVNGVTVIAPKNLKGMADINLGVEYRYSKFLSGFLNLNNVANFRYNRWDRYPTQRFNFMVGLSFIPF
jgi:hypothetical protein